MPSASEILTPVIFDVLLATIDTEYSQQLPEGTKYFSLQTRTAVACRFAFEAGHVATPVEPYATLKASNAYNSPEKFSCTPTVYLATSSDTDPVVEIVCWQSPPRSQIDTITIADTWATSDTITLTIGSDSLVVTIGGDTTTDEVALTLKQAFNGETITDATATVSPSGGAADLDAFANLVATVRGSVVSITGQRGTAFSLSVTEVTAGDGTATEATATTATKLAA